MQILFILPLLFFSCASAPETPETQETPGMETLDIDEIDPYIIEIDPDDGHITFGVTKEVYDQTLSEIKIFIENLNKIIASRNFNSWKDALTDERFLFISSAQFLREQSESPALKIRNKVLRNVNEYFLEVVVPSRTNSRADEIEFIDANNVKVLFLETRNRRNENNEIVIETRRLQLYELTKSADGWKIRS